MDEPSPRRFSVEDISRAAYTPSPPDDLPSYPGQAGVRQHQERIDTATAYGANAARGFSSQGYRARAKYGLAPGMSEEAIYKDQRRELYDLILSGKGDEQTMRRIEAIRHDLDKSPVDERMKRIDRDRITMARQLENWKKSATAQDKAINIYAVGSRGITRFVGDIPKAMAIGAKAVGDMLPESIRPFKDMDAKDINLYKWTEALEDTVNSGFPEPDPRLRDSFLYTQLPQAVASVGTFAAGGLAAKALKAPQLLATMTLGAGVGATENYEDAKAQGVSEEEAMRRAGLGALVGTSEAIPINRLINRFTGGAGGKGIRAALKEGLKGATEESLQELGQTIAENWIQDRPLAEGIISGAGAGGIVGFLASLGATVVGARVNRGVKEADPQKLNAVEIPDKSAPKSEQPAAPIAQATPAVAEEPAIDPVEAQAISRGEMALDAARQDALRVANEAMDSQEINEAEAQRIAQSQNAATGAVTAVRRPDPAPIPFEVTEAAGDKQPWQVTRKDYSDQAANLVKGPESEKTRRQAETYHAAQVRQAVRNGQEVPAEVLKDYPKVEKQARDALKEQAKSMGLPSGGGVKALRKRIQGRIAKADADFKAASNDLAKHFGGSLFSGIDPEVAKIVGRMMKALVAKGVYRFADAATAIAQVFPSQIGKIRSAVIDEWNKLRADNKNLTEATPLEDILEINAKNSPTGEVGNPGLSMPVSDPGVQALVNEVDQQRINAGVPNPRPRAVARTQAAMMLLDRKNRLRETLSKKVEGKDVFETEADVVAAQQMIQEDGIAAIQAGDVEKHVAMQNLHWGYRSARSETARKLGVRGLGTPVERMQRHITEALLEPPPKTRKKIDEAREAGDTKTVEEEQRKWAQQSFDLRDKLAVAGIDLADVQSMTDPEKAAKLLHVVQTAKASKADMAYEWWRNAILSGIQTFQANIVGNAANFAWHFGVRHFVDSVSNLVTRDKSAAQLRDYGDFMRGFLPGLAKGFKNAVKSWRTELPWLEVALGIESPVSKIENLDVAIPGKFGRIVRAPQRFLLAQDAFQKTLTYYMTVGAYAHKIAKGEGLNGAAYSQRVQELVTDPASEASAQALSLARKLAFQEEGGTPTKVFMQLRREIPGVRYKLPFIVTPANIFSQGLDATPLGLLSLAWQFPRGHFKGKEGKVRLREKFVNAAMAWGLTLAMWEAMDDDDGMPRITGAAGMRHKGTRETAYRTAPPQSIRIGTDKDGNPVWWSYARIEPMATAVSTIVDSLRPIKQGNAEASLKAPINSLMGQVQNKTFMSGISDIISLIDSPDPTNEAMKQVSEFVPSWWPNLFRQSARESRETIPERDIFGKTLTERVKVVGKRLVQQLEMGIIEDHPKIDLWGREVGRGANGLFSGPRSDMAYRILSFIDARPTNYAAGDRLLINWNNQHPDDQRVWPVQPSRNWKDIITGEEKIMDDARYERFLRESGTLAREIVNGFVTEEVVSNPTDVDLDVVEKLILRARDTTRKILTAEWSIEDEGNSR